MKKYGIGLDMGAASCGWVVVDESGKVKRVKGKDAIGVRLFQEGNTASERRTFRGSRRRYRRRKWRLRFLRTAELGGTNFEKEITNVDPNFFARMKYFGDSNYNKKLDPSNHGYRPYLMGNADDEKKFHGDFPTIYHLRHALATEDKKFDIRLVFLAIHHIVKYRGNFLVNGNAKDFKNGKFDWQSILSNVNNCLKQIYPEVDDFIKFDNMMEVANVAKDANMTNSDRQKKMMKLLFNDDISDKNAKKLAKGAFKEFTKAISGSVATHFDKIFRIENVEDNSLYKFGVGDIDDKMDILDEALTDEASYDLLNDIRKLYAEIKLSQILPEGMSMSEKMINLYNNHHEQLVTLRRFIKETNNDDAQQLYDAYIDDNISNDDFCKKLKKVLNKSDNPLAKQIVSEIDEYSDSSFEYMPKQRTGNNGVIPYQIHQNELDDIIKNQSKYYPWLGEENPVENSRARFPYKLDELVGFRVPYYVGPLVEGVKQQSDFAWMSKTPENKNKEITPWNFQDVVDVDKSANDFIQRLTITDSYLIGEDVLPTCSLLYQKFNVLNELNKVTIVQGDAKSHLSTAQKQRVFNDVFKHAAHKTIKANDLLDNLRNAGEIDDNATLEGLSSITSFNSNLSSYIDLKNIIGNKVDDDELQNDLEQIIEWSTTFEDSKIFAHKLSQLDWLSDKEIKRLSTKRYRGWGRVSKKLLTEITNKAGKSIIEVMWNTNKNFMQAVRDKTVQSKLEKMNNSVIDEQGTQNIINDLYISPQNKRSIKQCLLVVKDIVKAMHHQEPSWIFIETAHEKDNSGRTKSRKNRLIAKYKEADKILNDSVKGELNDYEDKDFQRDKLVLYFEQNGRDVYTGKRINNFENYQIDHILPQSLVKDDSLDNRVLVSAPINNGKDAHLSSEEFANRKGLWMQLHEAGLISRRKLNHLLMTRKEFNERTNTFIARQLVETRQVIKMVTKLLADQYKDTSIVNVKAGLSHEFRKMFGFPKLRDVNDYHHAFDAYLAAFMGRYLMLKNEGWQRFFMYGDYPKLPMQLEKYSGLSNTNVMGAFLDEDLIKSYDGNQVIWDRNNDLDYMKELFDCRHYLVTHRTYIDNSSMYKQTIYKAKEDKENPSKLGNKKLIPLKKNKPTYIYGGYTEEHISCYMLVRLHDKKRTLKMLAVPTRFYDQDNIHELMEKKLGKKFDVLISKLPDNQSYRDITKDGSRRYFRIDGDYRDEHQLAMPLKYQYVLSNIKLDNINLHKWFVFIANNFANYLDDYTNLSVNDVKLFDDLTYNEKVNIYKSIQYNLLDEVYAFISKQARKYFTMFSKTDCAKISDNYEGFKALEMNGKKNVLDSFIVGLHSNGQRVTVKEFSKSISFGRIAFRSPVTINDTLQVVHTSPTGLFKKVVKVSDLIKDE